MARVYVQSSSQRHYNTSFNSLQSKTKATISCWLKRTAAGNRISCGSYKDSQRAFAPTLWSDDNLYVICSRSDSNEFAYVANTSTDWVHVLAAFDGTATGNANRLKVWVNGVQQTLTFGSAGMPSAMASTIDGWESGCRKANEQYSDGASTWQACWVDVALGEAEALELYGGANPADIDAGSGTLVGNWRFSETSGNAADTSGNGWTLTAENAPGDADDPDVGGGGEQTVTPTGIATAEAFGTAVVAPGAVAILPSGIDSAEAFGTTVVAPGAFVITTPSIDSGEAFGTAVLSTGAVSVAPSAIDSAEAFGSHVVNAGGAAIVPDGIASAEAFGTATAAPGAVTVAPNGIETGEAFGSHVVTAGGLLVIVEGIASAEAFGSHTLTPGAVVVTVTGIESAESFGTAALSSLVSILAQAIDSAEAFGTAEVDVGSAVILPSGIASLEAFGTAVLTGGSALTPARSRLLVVPRQIRQFDA